MKKLVFFIAIIFTAGCTSIAVKKVNASKHPISLVCIKENPRVMVVDFLSVVEEGFARHGIETEIYEGEKPSHCEYTMTYTARRSWDIVTFLKYAELKLKRGRKTIGTASYRHAGGLALNKWNSTKTKMTPVFEELLSEFKRTNAPR